MPAAQKAVYFYAHSFLSEDDLTFTNRERLLTASHFKQVFDRPTKLSSEAFTVLSRENTLGISRLGIVVAKRNVKRSVDRNLIRRIIRESFRLNKAQLPAKDFVVIFKRPIKNMQRDKIRHQLINLWNRTAEP
jgi:ribonuclease P protein component